MTEPPLSSRTKDDLAKLARRRGVVGVDGMRKDELVRILSATPAAAPPVNGKAPANGKPAANGKTAANGKAAPAKPAAKPAAPAKPAAKAAPAKPAAKPAVNGTAPKPAAKLPPAPAPRPVPPARKPEPAKLAPKPPPSTLRVEALIPSEKDLSVKAKVAGAVKDRIVLTAPDAYWLHAMWELSLQSVQRAEAALGQDWHGAKPIIRLFDVTSSDTTSTSEAPLRDIVVHGGCSHWYVDIPQPPRSYRVDIGYLSRRQIFFVLARSNVLTPPKAGSSELVEDGLPSGEGRTERGSSLPADNAGPGPAGGRDLHDDAFRRPLKENAFGTGAVLPGKLKKFFFDIEAELIVYGKTDPAATVTLQNEPVKLRTDGSGTFTMRFSLPDSRQIIPAVATSADGMEEHTIVLAVERNTKRLDPMIHDLYGEQ